LNVGDAPDVSGPFVTGAASSAVTVRTLLEWNVDDPLPDVARR
jgi:hypothetical protein